MHDAVQSVDAAPHGFGCRILGFTVVEDTLLPGGKRWVRLKAPGGEGSEILLSRAATDPERAAIGNQTGGRVLFFLHTDDFEGDYETFRSKGIDFSEGPRDHAYGRVAVFKDLYGNRIDLIRPNRRRNLSGNSHIARSGPDPR